MKSGEKSKQQRIANRYYLINSLDSLIKESVYYRNNSDYLIESNKVISISVDSDEIKVEIK
jgi:hypothetical protein